MNTNMIAKSMLIVFAEMGVQIDKFDNTDEGIILLFTVPKSSYRKGANDVEMADEHLAKRVKKAFKGMGVVFADCRYRTRDEVWTEEKAKLAKRAAYKDLGYKDWEIR